MPLIHVNVPEGTLDDARKRQLIEQLTKTVLAVEGAPETPEALSISWLFLNEVKAGAWSIGGTPDSVRDMAKYLVYVTVPQGTLTPERKKLMIERVNEVLVDIGGATEAPDSAWCIINEVPMSNWGAGGRTISLLELAQFVGVDPNDARFTELAAASA